MAAHIASSMKPKSNTNNTNGNSNNGSNGYSSESSSGTNSNSPSPPPSPPQPRLTPSLSQCRRRLRSKTHSFVRRENNGSGLNFRWNLRYLVVLPLLYISGLFMCVGPVSELLGYAYVPGSVYRSHEKFQRLWDDIRFDNSSALQLSSVWKYKRRAKVQKPCPNSTAKNHFSMYRNSIMESPGSSGYLIVDANGGLNQQRSAAWAPVNYYLGVVHPILMDQGVIRIAPFANRLAMNVPPHIQLLRCIANYKALKFSLPIGTLAEKLVDRMIEKSSRTGGKYVSVHLRFEQDMVAFSCCVYDGGQAEKSEMDSFREKGWKGKFKRKDRIIIPALNRVEGKCPLTPVEVGLMLRGMGFDNNTAIYLASGKIYQAEKHLAPLLKMFPLLYTKESLATPDELAAFEGYSSRLAALDYTVSLFSEVFVTTQGGNFPHFLMGHRRFLFDGHAKTIKPDKRKLVVLLQDMGISWKAFKDEMEAMLADSDRKGMMVPRVKKFNRKTSIYTYPLPECACLRHSQNSTLRLPDSANVLDSYHASTR
ncbi:GDP-fucose protein O-fucosyltransferase [Corchorus capsularis]|uniref:O-fucosyltransferase family protein n=1 Tax=Corchorus capsularis TaxID=210143 RepID=A0A1R3GX39_COCAP|nr:GDP-fucose protein O-fucosyltransferase [Corchorus capsularis]